MAEENISPPQWTGPGKDMVNCANYLGRARCTRSDGIKQVGFLCMNVNSIKRVSFKELIDAFKKSKALRKPDMVDGNAGLH